MLCTVHAPLEKAHVLKTRMCIVIQIEQKDVVVKYDQTFDNYGLGEGTKRLSMLISILSCSTSSKVFLACKTSRVLKVL